MRTGLETREELFAVMEQIAEEREAARPIVRELVARGRSIDDIEIPEGWRTAGMVLELSRDTQEIEQSDPGRSRVLYQLGMSIAMSLLDAEYPGATIDYLRGEAWKNIAWIHQYQSEFEAALQAVASALAYFACHGELAENEAAVQLVKAITLISSEREEEGLKAVAMTEQVFLEFGDERRFLIAKVVSAMAHHVRQEYAIAQGAYEELLNEVGDSCDSRTLASLQHNLGTVYARQGDGRKAKPLLQSARALYQQLGLSTQRTDWLLARVLLLEGNFEDARNLMERLRESFLAHHMKSEVAEVGLDLIEVLVVTNRLEEARDLAHDVFSEFVDAKLNREAMTALAYLRDLNGTSGEWRHALSQVRASIGRRSFAASFCEAPSTRKDN